MINCVLKNVSTLEKLFAQFPVLTKINILLYCPGVERLDRFVQFDHSYRNVQQIVQTNELTVNSIVEIAEENVTFNGIILKKICGAVPNPEEPPHDLILVLYAEEMDISNEAFNDLVYCINQLMEVQVLIVTKLSVFTAPISFAMDIVVC